MKKWIDYFITFVIIISIAFIGVYSTFIIKKLGFLISTLQNKVEIYEQYRQEELNKLEETINKIINLVIRNDENQLELVEDINKNIKEIQKIQSQIENELKTKKQINLDNVEDIKKANIIVYNTTMRFGGSGSHIVIKGKHYILTCAHLVKKEEDFIWGVLDNGTWHPLGLIKINKREDLALFEIFMVEDLPYLEISNETPEVGSEVIIIGNPNDLKDIITDGIIAKVKNKGYILTNKIYFGSSGGAVLYKGKIVGIVTKIKVYTKFSEIFVNYAYSINLETIKKFLK